MRLIAALLAAAACMGCQTAPDPVAPRQASAAPEPPAPAIDMDLFQLGTNEWVAMHFFAYHAARAQAGIEDRMSVALLPEDAALLAIPEIAAAFAPVAEAYAPILDSPLIRGRLFGFLVGLDEGAEGIKDAQSRAILETFMDTYRTYFWPRHRAMAETYAHTMRSQIASNGPAMAAAVAEQLGSEWGDEPYQVWVSPYVNWAGAMSGAKHVYFSALDEDVANHALEVFFHETAHNRPIGATIRPAAEAALEAHGLENPRFWHYILFTATGRAARQVLGEDYVTYLEATGLRTREDTRPWYDALEAVWDDHDTLEARAMAAAALIAAKRS